MAAAPQSIALDPLVQTLPLQLSLNADPQIPFNKYVTINLNSSARTYTWKYHAARAGTFMMFVTFLALTVLALGGVGIYYNNWFALSVVLCSMAPYLLIHFYNSVRIPERNAERKELAHVETGVRNKFRELSHLQQGDLAMRLGDIRGRLPRLNPNEMQTLLPALARHDYYTEVATQISQQIQEMLQELNRSLFEKQNPPVNLMAGDIKFNIQHLVKLEDQLLMTFVWIAYMRLVICNPKIQAVIARPGMSERVPVFAGPVDTSLADRFIFDHFQDRDRDYAREHVLRYHNGTALTRNSLHILIGNDREEPTFLHNPRIVDRMNYTNLITVLHGKIPAAAR